MARRETLTFLRSELAKQKASFESERLQYQASFRGLEEIIHAHVQRINRLQRKVKSLCDIISTEE